MINRLLRTMFIGCLFYDNQWSIVKMVFTKIDITTISIQLVVAYYFSITSNQGNVTYNCIFTIFWGCVNVYLSRLSLHCFPSTRFKLRHIMIDIKCIYEIAVNMRMKQYKFFVFLNQPCTLSSHETLKLFLFGRSMYHQLHGQVRRP